MDDQLQLLIDDDDTRPGVPARLGFPVAADGGRPFDDDARFFEPWWPGAHALLRRAGDRLELRTEHLSDPLAIFPELRDSLADLRGDGLIVEGTLLALDEEGRPDAALLRRRLSGGRSVEALAEAAFVAQDLPWFEGDSLARKPFIERRRRLASVVPGNDHCVLGPGLVGEGLTLGRAVASMGLRALSARRLDGRWRAGAAGYAWLRLPLHEPPTVPTRPFLVLLEKLPLGGSA
jgi:bifunctional non-homologous end joining protein LigD